MLLIRSCRLGGHDEAHLLLELGNLRPILRQQRLLAGCLFKNRGCALLLFESRVVNHGVFTVVGLFIGGEDLGGLQIRVAIAAAGLLVVEAHEELLSVTPNLRARTRSNVLFDRPPIFLEELHALNEETVFFVGPAAVRLTVFANFPARRVLTLFGAEIRGRVAEEVRFGDLAGVVAVVGGLRRGRNGQDIWQWRPRFEIETDKLARRTRLAQNRRVSLARVFHRQLDFLGALGVCESRRLTLRRQFLGASFGDAGLRVLGGSRER